MTAHLGVEPIGFVTGVSSNVLRVELHREAKGFTKVGPFGSQAVGAVNSYLTIPVGAHRVVSIVASVGIKPQRSSGDEAGATFSEGQYELEAVMAGRFEGDKFRSGLVAYPPIHAPVFAATQDEVRAIFVPRGASSLSIGEASAAAGQKVFVDANLLLGHHCAIVGSTGSGKSCTVMAILDSLIERSLPGAHIVILDINGEYAHAFAPESARGENARVTILGPAPRLNDGLYLPHWFMNNEEHVALFGAAERVQEPILQRAISDARVADALLHDDISSLRTVSETASIVERLAQEKNAQAPIRLQLESLREYLRPLATAGGHLAEVWMAIGVAAKAAADQCDFSNELWQATTATQKAALDALCSTIRDAVRDACSELGLGSGTVSVDFDAPVYYDLQRLCDFFLPQRIRMEQESDPKIGTYVATLQMRLNRLLADGRYDFMTRVPEHEDPLGSYLRLIFGEDPGCEGKRRDWPGPSERLPDPALEGPSVTIFDLSLVASDVLENVTSLLGRIVFEFAVRRNPRAEFPVLLVLEEAHRFVPARRGGDESRSTDVFERIAKEGRKFGVSLLLASQRPSELSETVVAQCGTVIAHRLTHEADQALLRHATALTSRALLDQLPGLAQQHALVTGVSTGVPVAVRVRDVERPPRSSDPDFIGEWGRPDGRERLRRAIDEVAGAWQAGIARDLTAGGDGASGADTDDAPQTGVP